jgi:hypothetical protein
VSIFQSIISLFRSQVGASATDNKSVINHNEALADLSKMFFDDETNPTFGVNYLNKEKLDFSVESLKHLDDYLEFIRKAPEITKEWTRVVLRAGAYVGEVIRLNDKMTIWEWIDLDTAKSLNPNFFGEMPHVAASSAILYNNKSSFSFPLAKIEKYLENGSEDSTHFFVQVQFAKQS